MADTPKRPRDANQLAKLVADLATGEVSDQPTEKNEPRQKAGRRGGAARADSLTPEVRKAIASAAAAARWKK